MQAHDKKYDCDEVIPVTPHVAHHPPCCCRNGTNGCNGDEDAHGKERRGPKRPSHRHLALLADEPNDERDARQMTRTEHDAQHAPNGSRGEGQQRRTFDGTAQGGEELFHARLSTVHFGVSSTPSSRNLARMSSLPIKPTWRARSRPSAS